MTIPTVAEAAETLQGILSQIRPELPAADRSRISDELVSFANPASSYRVPDEASYRELRETALVASDELDAALSAAAVARIRARSEALTRHVAVIQAVTDEAERRAKTQHLAVVRQVLTSSQAIVEGLQEAKKAFDEARPEAGYAALATALDEIQSLRAKLPT